ncbi:cupin domain-containing protein [Vreelandella arcis]|uniref:Transcriptional regulator, XRE family with cupin sensor n=1 Tax=Vreelandella arcis TaxID=416873 RepID=A0A1H0CIY5_9GAMM|nr:cupin domain-containing protein [Halomonas arcis]SDN57782.1 transcriptional regulator, XRE family with cupin sensor [Halomonas arcis]
MDDNNTTLGYRLRQLRLSKRMSLRALAERSGLSHPFISSIEKDTGNPSISSLKRILDNLDVTLSDFFAEKVSVERVAFYKASELVELADGKELSYRQVGANLKNAKMMILHERYAPGASTGDDTYQHYAEEGGVVVSGRILITVGDKSRVLESGDAYYFDSTLPHKMENVFEEECIVVSSVTPPTF